MHLHNIRHEAIQVGLEEAVEGLLALTVILEVQEVLCCDGGSVLCVSLLHVLCPH